MGVLAFTSQARGFFSKAAAGGVGSLEPELRRDFENDENLERLAHARQLARDLGTAVAAIVVAFITSQAVASVPIIGPQTLEQLHDSLAEPDLVLTPEMIHYLTTRQI
jgi:aryl-alcohol dehydrogenase-like predicted oxidoreductase